MEALRYKLREIRDAWLERTLNTDEYKAAVLQTIREYTNTPVATGQREPVEHLVKEMLQTTIVPVKAPLVWIEILGAQYCTGKIGDTTIKAVITSSYQNCGSAWRELELWTICSTGRNWIGRCTGYIDEHKLKLTEQERTERMTTTQADAQLKALAEYLFNS